MILMIDNYDSFTYNLVQYLGEMGEDLRVYRNDQITLDEMPPKDKPQPAREERSQLLGWIDRALHEAALARAGDPGPVVLRRLNNAEYTYTLRDLTGVESLEPAREFPGDSAAGEGFMNTGNYFSGVPLPQLMEAGE